MILIRQAASVKTESTQEGYPVSNITDNDDRSWWIAGDGHLPHIIVVELEKTTWVTASRIVFQKDSSSYKHKVETSKDGKECARGKNPPVETATYLFL